MKFYTVGITNFKNNHYREITVYGESSDKVFNIVSQNTDILKENEKVSVVYPEKCCPPENHREYIHKMYDKTGNVNRNRKTIKKNSKNTKKFNKSVKHSKNKKLNSKPYHKKSFKTKNFNNHHSVENSTSTNVWDKITGWFK